HEHVADIIPGTEPRRPLGPQLDHPRGTSLAEGGKCRSVDGAVQDDLVPAVRQRWPPVRHAPHVVRAWSLEPARTERARSGRLVGTVLPPGGDNHPGASQRVDPQLRFAGEAHIRAGYALGAVLTSMLPLYATPLTRTTGASGASSAGQASPAAETPVPPS